MQAATPDFAAGRARTAGGAALLVEHAAHSDLFEPIEHLTARAPAVTA
jgi:hypothetical protein